VARVAKRILEDTGFRVEVFASGEEALARLAAAPERWDALVTDFHIPEMNGARIAYSARALVPSLPIVIASGSFEDVTLPEGCVRLDKPFGPDRLLAAIAAARAARVPGGSGGPARAISLPR
jgi:CheY-like chemotaxis protein